MTTTPVHDIELEIGGMTCASCAMRIEKKLNNLDGVTATVNYATEKATVTAPAGYGPQALIAEVEKTGYTAWLQKRETGQKNEDTELASLRHRLVVATVLATPVILMAMIPAWQFRHWQWVSLILAAPVIVWAGRPFHAAAWANLKHGAATMDTLVSVGTLSAFLWSVYAQMCIRDRSARSRSGGNSRCRLRNPSRRSDSRAGRSPRRQPHQTR